MEEVTLPEDAVVLRLTVPVNCSLLDKVTVALVLDPAWATTLDGVTETEKSPT
jgi:hypothetical protein